MLPKCGFKMLTIVLTSCKESNSNIKIIFTFSFLQITKIQYPYMSDERKKSYLLDSVNFYLNKYAHDWFKSNEEEEEGDKEKEESSKREKSSIINVPLTDLMLYSGIWENCSDINSLRLVR